MQNKRKRIASTPSESGRGSSRQARSREATGGSRVEDGTPQLEGQDGDEDAAAPRKRQRKSTTYDSDRPSEYGEELFLEQQQQQQQPVNGSNGHQDSETPAPTGEIGQPGEEETEAALNERYEIWESYAEEYHDSAYWRCVLLTCRQLTSLLVMQSSSSFPWSSSATFSSW